MQNNVFVALKCLFHISTGGFVIEDDIRRNFTVQPEFEKRNNWLIGKTYQNRYSQLSLSRSPRKSKNTSRYPYLDISDLQN